MSPSVNRGRILVQELGAGWVSKFTGTLRPPKGWEAVAEVKRLDKETGWSLMIRNQHNGTLAAWYGGSIESLPQDKARAALSALLGEDGADAEELPANAAEGGREVAALLQQWRGKAAMTQGDAATLLGVPLRTYQGWEAGRVGNTLRRLIVLALKAFD
ncbi:hypothetical protein SAMN05428997_1193 [Bosea sp. CRIB-10]|uniref:helix-turn-helix domain-containing protein n=1 Tax=Bosea sp. CRIB-10 TaxID=378404 RepID=UPI0008EFD4EF|nr:helix-turn-helix transcriptional regulator [Bosea sp. CRIB-10]SFD14724.1 hypothetical protein SAMN05428997_1193 [Bosea sp. CRIB-10]